jgi:hypothetical protein
MKFCSNSDFSEIKIFSHVPNFIENPIKSQKKYIKNSEDFLVKNSIFDFSIILQIQHVIDTILHFVDFSTINQFVAKKKILVKKLEDKNVSLQIILINIYNSQFHIICKNMYHPIKLSKQSLTPMKYEFNLSFHTINYLRKLSPHFGYTFGKINRENNKVSIIQEYIEGETMSRYLKKNIRKNNNNDLSGIFLSFFIQLITALEIAQESLQFTHHDLHFDNIMIRNISKDIPHTILNILGKEYIIENFGYCPTIIDFERSTSRYKKECSFLNTYMDHLKYGYIGIYVPGIDIFRILFTLYSHVLLCEERKEFQSLGFKIFHFVEYIFENFYKMTSPILDKNTFGYHAEHYFNTTHFPQVFLTPLDLLNFLEEHSNNICKIFKRTSFPWITKRTFPLKPIIHRSNMNSQEYENKKKIALKDVLCLENSYMMEEQILFDYMNHKEIQLSEKDFMLLMDKIIVDYEYPSLFPDHLRYLQQFYEKNNFIILTYEYYFIHYFIMNDGVGGTIFASEKNAIYTRLYRTMCSIYAFLNMEAKNKNVIGEMKKFDRSKITYIPTVL